MLTLYFCISVPQAINFSTKIWPKKSVETFNSSYIYCPTNSHCSTLNRTGFGETPLWIIAVSAMQLIHHRPLWVRPSLFCAKQKQEKSPNCFGFHCKHRRPHKIVYRPKRCIRIIFGKGTIKFLTSPATFSCSHSHSSDTGYNSHFWNTL